MHKGLSFLAFLYPLKYLKSFLSKGISLETTTITNICIVYHNRARDKFVFFNFSIIKLYNFFIYFYIWF